MRRIRRPEIIHDPNLYNPKRRPGDTRIMRQALRDGVIIKQWPNRAMYRFLDQFDTAAKYAPATPTELNDPAADSRAEQFVQDTRPPISGQANPFIAGQWSELARIWVPPRLMGIIRRIDTYLEDELGNPITNLVNYGKPFDPGSDILQYCLRLSTYDPEGFGTYVDGTGYHNIPGTPFFPLSYWRDMRFPWGSDAGRIFLLIPGGHMLRLFQFWRDDYPGLLAAGKLEGTIQSAQSISAAWNARRGWTS